MAAFRQPSDRVNFRHVASRTKSNYRGKPITPIEAPTGLDPKLVALGRRLFHDPRLSRDGTVSCASCHDLSQGGDDGQCFSIGVDGQPGDINAPTVFNSALNIAQFWDGRAANLRQQVDGPIHHPKEMASDWAEVLQRIGNDASLTAAFASAFGGPATAERVRIAIEAFETSLATLNAPFDGWLQGDDDAVSKEALEGFELFKRHGCISCHQGEAVGGNLFQRLGVMREYFVASRELRPSDLGRFNHTQREQDRHVFRVPSLRNVALTGPYFHDGSALNLEDAVHVMLHYQVGADEPDLAEIRKIVVFLNTLTGDTPKETL
ncbi:Cytochrome c551 peroxidase precursor [Botrimarina colliarenosi]|uniref:Cytochrome c551 peroxidase n=1 Tax=Botrimarina colliarenosi TaxID=2528001 RepID=A0A5C6AL12_9BACT|nr:cytochrome-c peroxidase [Botrimarina colliarenosi]TWU00147.1 Cytochrome c551 peroxidase precursor [Botrimarina colliarenosi]